MSQPIAKVTNRCGTSIEVGHSYLLNQAPQEKACREASGDLRVKVLELRTLEDGRTIARLAYPRDKKNNVYLEWTSIDRLYEPLRISRRFGTAAPWAKQIRQA